MTKWSSFRFIKRYVIKRNPGLQQLHVDEAINRSVYAYWENIHHRNAKKYDMIKKGNKRIRILSVCI